MEGLKVDRRGRESLQRPSGRGLAEPAVELVNVGISVADLEVLRGLSMSCLVGELVLIVGPNGSGKTTLLSVLSGFLRPAEGEIRLNGEKVQRFEPQEVRKLAGGVGRSFQDPVIIGGMSVLDNVLVGRRVEGEGLVGILRGLRRGQERGEELLREAAGELLRRMEFGPRLGTMGAELSAGQRKKTDVARALFADAKLVLLDEPLANTDGRGALGIVSLLREAADEGRTVLAIEHRVNVIERIADRVVSLRGR